jgi:hypothetical protein
MRSMYEAFQGTASVQLKIIRRSGQINPDRGNQAFEVANAQLQLVTRYETRVN